MNSKDITIVVLLLAISAVLFCGGFYFIRLMNYDQDVIYENFTDLIDVSDGKQFGTNSGLTFELSNGGTFKIDSESGWAVQRSDHYEDTAIIRSTNPLPETYVITVVVGEIDYFLENLRGLSNDPKYQEGPLNENGCYLIAITDEAPVYSYENDWWHKHRKLVIDVDNNKWGHGMPNPIFMVYFDNDNQLNAYNGLTNKWQKKWEKGVKYESDQWYKIQIEKTKESYIFTIATEDGVLLKSATIAIQEVWHHEKKYPEYFVIGEPHVNYYQGKMKIKSIMIDQ